MPAVLRNGKWVFDQEEEQQAPVLTAPVGMSVTQQARWEQEQAANQTVQQGEQLAAAGGDNRPFWATDFGMAASDTGKILANAGVALGTDYLDLAAGVGDVVMQAGSLATGNGWDWNKVMEDSDNPWTQWRRNAFRTESQAGQAVSNLLRIGTALVALPKVAAKGIALPFKAVGGVDKLGDVAKAADGIGNLFNKLDDLAKAKRNPLAAAGLEAVEKGLQKGTAGQKAASRALRNDWLGLTYAEISQGIAKAPELKGAADWFDTVKTSSKALTQLSKGTPGAKIRTLGEALAWDAFVALNVYGEGDSQFDETLGDLAMSSGIPWLQSIGSLSATYAEDNGLVRKGKQLLEGLASGAAMSAALDMARVYKYASNFKKASPADRAKIVEALNLNAQEIGDSLGKTLVANGRAQGERLPGQMDALQFEVDNARKAEELKATFRAEQVQQRAVQAAQAQTPGGQMVPYGQRPQAPTEGVPPDLNSPVQNRLAQMEGLASEVNEDPLYQEWLLQRIPEQDLLPPTIGENPVQRQFAAQGEMPAASVPPTADDLQQYKAWLEERARMPEAEMDPRVQQSLRRLEGIGELAPVQAQLPADGLAIPAAIQPVQVTEIRPPEATVTPDTIRSAFERDAFRAFAESQELTFEEGTDGVMRSLATKVKELMPRTRVDALEYLQTFRPAANQYGVVPAADSVWVNFMYERGLAEGWATIDPATFAVKFNRKAAAELDRGQAVLKQAAALDEASDQVRYEEWLWNKEFVNGNPQMRPEVQDSLGKMEARDAYDEWEANRAIRNAESDAVKAGMEVDGIDNFEQLRLSEADAAKLQGQLSDEEVVREMLGTTLDSVEPATVQKAETGRGWEVYDRNGELLGTARTRGAAEKIAEQQAKRDRDALLSRARQMEADAADDVIETAIGAPVYDSDIVGKVKLTDAQINAVQGILPQLDTLLDDAWKGRRGESAFFNINELSPQKRTFELTQGDMQALQDGIRSAIDEAGNLKGSPKLRALRNLADKLDTEMKLIEPQARAQRFVDDVVADTGKYIDHGEFCDLI